MMIKVENILKNIMLKNVSFVLDGKNIKTGKIKVFNTKQFFIRFKIENNGEMKEFELPYPYGIKVIKNGFVFDYCLSAFCPPTETVYYKMLLMDKKEASRIHNTYLSILTYPLDNSK